MIILQCKEKGDFLLRIKPSIKLNIKNNTKTIFIINMATRTVSSVEVSMILKYIRILQETENAK